MADRISISPGRFYPMDPLLLLKQVDACYRHPLGPGEVPLSHTSIIRAGREKPPLALISPHGALGHSGPIAAHAYSLMAPWMTKARAEIAVLQILKGGAELNYQP